MKTALVSLQATHFLLAYKVALPLFESLGTALSISRMS